MSAPHRVVILGGGFGGLYAAKSLGRAPVDLTVVDRRNFHLFQPLLYQVATGALSPGEIHGYDAMVWRTMAREKWRAAHQFLAEHTADEMEEALSAQ